MTGRHGNGGGKGRSRGRGGGRGRDRRGASILGVCVGVCVAPVLAVAVLVAAAVAGLGPAWAGGAGATAPVRPGALGAAAMAGTERYCTGYETTFHGEWKGGEAGEAGESAAGAPVPFRIGVNAGGEGCYAQLNVMTPPGVAPYELPRFGAKARGADAWTLRYRETVLEVDAGSGSVVRREGGEVARTGVLRAGAPAVEDLPPPPSARQRKRWYGRWRGSFPGVPSPVGLHFAAAEAGGVKGRISALLMAKTFTGRFHGEMLVFRWRNRHVGLIMEPDGDTLVYHDYKGRVSRFRRRR